MPNPDARLTVLRQIEGDLLRQARDATREHASELILEQYNACQEQLQRLITLEAVSRALDDPRPPQSRKDGDFHAIE